MKIIKIVKISIKMKMYFKDQKIRVRQPILNKK
jgi:hypothetical protein